MQFVISELARLWKDVWLYVELQTKVRKDFTSTEKAPTRAFSWWKAPTSAFTFKTLLRHYANQPARPLWLLCRGPNFTSTYHGVNACLAYYLNSVFSRYYGPSPGLRIFVWAFVWNSIVYLQHVTGQWAAWFCNASTIVTATLVPHANMEEEKKDEDLNQFKKSNRSGRRYFVQSLFPISWNLNNFQKCFNSRL